MSSEKDSKEELDVFEEDIETQATESVPILTAETSNSNAESSNESTTEQLSKIVAEDCKMDDGDITINESYKEKIINDGSVIEETIPKSSSEDVIGKIGEKLKEVPAFRMQMGKEEIEKMIKEGTLEKVSEGYYKVKAESLKDLKVASEPIPKNLETIKKRGKRGTITKKLNAIKGTANLPSTSSQVPVSNISTSSTTLSQNVPQATSSFIQQQTPYIALMPMNQNTGISNSPGTLLALPVQQNVPIYNPNLPTYVAVQTQNLNTTLALTENSPTSIVTTANSSQAKMDAPVVTSIETSSPQFHESSPETISIIEPSTSTPSLRPSTRSKAVVNQASATNSVPIKRKPQFENTTTVKKPYKYARPLHKKRKTMTKVKASVSDVNSSEEEEDMPETKSKAYGKEIASMFFKKIGEPKKESKTLLDRLHNSIFDDSQSDSDEESEDSDVDEEASQIQYGKSNYETVNCPGPGKFEVPVGRGQNSKLSIIRSTETKAIKNFLYEIYKVRVTSSGREANTNILIPIPDGYKFDTPPPSRAREEFVEFSHVAHEDPASSNYVSPQFLEKLAKTQLKLRKYKDEIKVLRRRYLELLEEYANRPQFSTLSDLVGASSKFLTEDQLVFFLMQLKAGAHNMQGIRYSVREKVLALSIYQKSPEVYKWFRKMFNLPSKRVLDQWLEEVGSQDPQLLKKLMYHVYTTYNFKANP